MGRICLGAALNKDPKEITSNFIRAVKYFSVDFKNSNSEGKRLAELTDEQIENLSSKEEISELKQSLNKVLSIPRGIVVNPTFSKPISLSTTLRPNTRH